MKKKTALVLLPVFITLFAAADPHLYRHSKLSIESYDNIPMVLVLDNRVIQRPSAHILLERVAPGRHSVRLVKQLPSYYGSVPAQQIAYEGFIAIPAASMVRMLLVNKELRLIEQHPIMGNTQCNDVDDPFYDNHNGYGHGYAFPSMIYRQPQNMLCNICGHSPCICCNNYGNQGMNDATYEHLIRSLSNFSFDRTRLQVAEQAIEMNGCTASQVLGLMHMFDFESDRLQLAKFAWHYVADRQNYFIVSDGFTFSSSISQLNQYIAHN